MYKYTVGNFNDFNKAMNLQKEIRTNGFKEAFVVAFKDGKRINMKDALLLQKK